MSGNGVITSDVVDNKDGSKSGGQVIGINLGSDACAEHEFGIENLRKVFGVPQKPERRKGIRGFIWGDLVGADVRTVTRVPKELKFYGDIDGYSYLIYSNSFGWGKSTDLTSNQLNDMVHARDDEELSTAWSESDFGIRIKNDVLGVGATILGQIYGAFKKKNIMFFFGGRGGPFRNPGLVIAIRSRMSEDLLSKMKTSDLDSLHLSEVVEGIYKETALIEKLKTAGKSWFALSPRWIRNDEMKSRYPIIFWLNPCEQRRNNWGWFTVEQLLEWIDNRGPIPMKVTL